MKKYILKSPVILDVLPLAMPSASPSVATNFAMNHLKKLFEFGIVKKDASARFRRKLLETEAETLTL